MARGAVPGAATGQVKEAAKQRKLESREKKKKNIYVEIKG